MFSFPPATRYLSAKLLDTDKGLFGSFFVRNGVLCDAVDASSEITAWFEPAACPTAGTRLVAILGFAPDPRVPSPTAFQIGDNSLRWAFGLHVPAGPQPAGTQFLDATRSPARRARGAPSEQHAHKLRESRQKCCNNLSVRL
eukprot:5772505-Pyramimonas_sp.AAC.1